MDINTQPPSFGPTQPVYPHLMQLLRVSGGMVPGPTGGFTSSSAAAGIACLYYMGAVQQLQGSGLPRDREPCLIDDVIGFGLAPNYYLGRLASQYNGLPVYEVVASSALAMGMLGVTFSQFTQLLSILTPTQIQTLNNLTPCQIAVLLTLPPTNIQEITTLTPQQAQNIIITTPSSQSQPQPNTTFNLVTQIPPGTVVNLTQTATNEQITEISVLIPPTLLTILVQSFPTNVVQSLFCLLTPGQLSSLMFIFQNSGITTSQFNVLIQMLLNQLPNQMPPIPGQQNIQNLLDQPSAPLANLIKTQLPTAINQLLEQVEQGIELYLPATGIPTTSPTTGVQGYVDPTTGYYMLWPAGQSTPTQVAPSAGGGGGNANNTLTPYDGTTTSSYVTVFTVTSSKGLHGIMSINNTGVTNGMNVQVVITDIYGNTGTTIATPVLAGGYATFDIDTITATSPATHPPNVTVSLQVEDQSSGSPTTYNGYASVVD